jgi:hypothetical protein
MKALSVLILVAFFAIEAFPQIVINEFSNANKVMPYNEDDEADDWIEIYNKGVEAVNLHYYSLTDNPNNLYKWFFPSVTIYPGQHLLVYASGNDIPSKSNTNVMHWETAVGNHNEWSYFIGTSEPPQGWNSNNFNDFGWNKGHGGFGANRADTSIKSFIPASAQSLFTRCTFFIADTAKILEAMFYHDFSDGFIAYINGVEVARKNIQGSKSPYDAVATKYNQALLWKGELPQSWVFNKEKLQEALKPGENVLAIQVHKHSATSKLFSAAYVSFGIADASSHYAPNPQWMKQNKTALHTNFKLSAGEEIVLSNALGVPIDGYPVPSLQLGHSVGRSGDGGDNWCYFISPTPKWSNNGQACYSGYEPIPAFSLEGGFYSGSQAVSITAQNGSTIRYTTNGNTPREWDRVYSAPIPVGQTMAITARAFGSGNTLPSHPVTNTYFVDENTNLYIISITTDSANLWDYHSGIYVKGPGASSEYPYFGANFWKSWEKEARVEVYGKDKQLKASLNTGLRIHGGWSRGFEQKSFRFHFRGNYGVSSLDYAIFSDKPEATSFKRLVIRNGGQDFFRARFRDALFQRLSKNTHLDYLAYEPAAVYLNGQYWGHYGIRERTDKHYISTHYNIPSEGLDILEHKGHIVVREGSDTGFYNIHDYIMAADPSNANLMEEVDTKLDLKNFTDFFVVQTFISNFDWIGEQTGNMRLWRQQGEEGKWRYILADLDYGMGLKNGSLPTDNSLKLVLNPPSSNYHSRMLNKLAQNTRYKHYFINRYADLLNTAYHINNISSLTESFKTAISQEMVRHTQRWNYSVNTWNENINYLLDFSSQRIPNARQQLQDEFGLLKQVNVTLNINPPEAGVIQINSIIPDSLPWSGIYYDGVPVSIKAIGNYGYGFSFWSANGLMAENNPNDSISINLSSEETFTANFIWVGVEGEEQSPFLINIAPNPSNSQMQVHIEMKDGFFGPYHVEILSQGGHIIEQWQYSGN